MILVDTSIWVYHLRRSEARLADLLERESVLGHPYVIGELALGNVHWQSGTMRILRDLPQAVVADPVEVLRFIHDAKLIGSGIAMWMPTCWLRSA